MSIHRQRHRAIRCFQHPPEEVDEKHDVDFSVNADEVPLFPFLPTAENRFKPNLAPVACTTIALPAGTYIYETLSKGNIQSENEAIDCRMGDAELLRRLIL